MSRGIGAAHERALDATVVVMAKAPKPGRVKTRLCPPCTPDEAARIAEAALLDTLDAVAQSHCRRSVLALDGRWAGRASDAISVVAQVEGSLGDRLDAALACTRGPVLGIGMDTPQITSALINASLERLLSDDVDAVLGPAFDGGYWAIGLRARCRQAFVGVPMSTPSTGARQLWQLRSLGLRVAELPTLRDVDTFADALTVAAEVPDSRFARAVVLVRAGIERPLLLGTQR